MKNKYGNLIALILLVLFILIANFGNAFTNSSNINLHIPQVGDSGTSWGAKVSDNFGVLDTFFCNRVSIMTADRLAIFNSGSCFEDGDLLDFITGVDNRTSIQTDGAGGVFFNTPQDLDTTADLILNSLNLSNSLTIGNSVTIANFVTLSDFIANRLMETGPTNTVQPADTAKLIELAAHPSTLNNRGQVYALDNSVLYYKDMSGETFELSGALTHAHGTVYNDDVEITMQTQTGLWEIINTLTAGEFDNTVISAAVANIAICSECGGHYSLCGKVSYKSTNAAARDIEIHVFHNAAIVNAAGSIRGTAATTYGDASFGCPIVEAAGGDYFDVRMRDLAGTPRASTVREMNFTINRTGD